MFGAPLLVRRGDAVLTRLVRGTLVVVARAVALEDGALGSTIRLRLNDSRGHFRARVTGTKQVAVDGLIREGTP
jgi:flagella basal body P-ring formation protein FlgA